MRQIVKAFLLPLSLLLSASLMPGTVTPSADQDKRPMVALKTTHGTIVLELFNETPLHRDNFLKLVKKGAYDSLLFHRVIKDFVIQGGDPDSKKAISGQALGDGDVGYTVPAEFNPNLYHRKGVLATARDQNKTRASSGIQVFIVQGKVQTDSLLEVAETRINKMLARHYAWNNPDIEPLFDSILTFEQRDDQAQLTRYRDSLEQLLEDYNDFERYAIPREHKEVYKTVGGTPHLDQNYTVFGRVVRGLDIVDHIASVETDERDRPTEDVRILSARIIN